MAPMAEWLIADLSLFDVHLQLWMLLVCIAGLVRLRLGNTIMGGSHAI
jgi:hypothetical protein